MTKRPLARLASGLFALLTGACASAPAPADLEAFDRPGVLALTQELSRDSLFGRQSDTDGSRKAQDLIIARMQAAGLIPFGGDYRHPFLYGDFINRETGEMATPDRNGTNLIGLMPGRRTGGPALVVTAHYDHLGVRNGEIYNGADDNASGVAGMVAVAEYFRASPPRHDVIFVAFDAEEQGFGGSRAFIANPPVPLERLAANLNLDMISRGDNDALYASALAATPGLRPMLEKIAGTAPVPLKFGYDGSDPEQDDWTQQSDHVVFFQKGIPHVYLGVEDHADYHKPGDDFAKIEADFFLRSVETAVMVADVMDRELGRIAAMRR